MVESGESCAGQLPSEQAPPSYGVNMNTSMLEARAPYGRHFVLDTEELLD